MFDSSPFVPLDVRSCFSIKEGAFIPEALALRAAHLGMPAVALTDRDGLYGAARFVAACERERVQPILGASLTVRATTPPPIDAHVVLLAADTTGYANLCRLITDAHMLGERGDPWVDAAQILAHASGLIALLGPGSPAGRLARSGRIDMAATELRRFKEAFGDRLYVAVEHRMEEASNAEIRAMLRTADRAEVPAVATNPVRYLEPGDAFLADALECMRRIVPVAATNVSRANAEGYLKSPAAMRALFAERPDLCDTTLEIAERCNSGHPLGVAAANAALDLYRDEGLFERARSLEPVFADAVHGLKGFPRVVDIRSIGLAAGIDLAPIDGAPGLRGARALDAAFFDEDLVIRVVGDTLVLASALVVSEALIAAIVGKVAHFLQGLR